MRQFKIISKKKNNTFKIKAIKYDTKQGYIFQQFNMPLE